MSVRPPTVILVCESEYGYRMLLEDLLSVEGFSVRTFSSDADALRHLKSPEGEEVQAVLCQAPPPGTKHSLVGKIRSAPALKDMPVLCLSPSNGLPERAYAFRQGASEYLLRPVSPVTLAERVQHWAGREHVPY